MLYEYILDNYQRNEPIFLSDIDLPVSEVNLRQMFKSLCDDGKIVRFDTGIYYLPKPSRLKGGVPLAADDVAFAKYISRKGAVYGFYSGNTFANQLGISTQVPIVEEIVSNNASSRVREVKVRDKRIMLRKSRTLVTNENYIVLQLLELLKDLEKYYDIEFADVCDKLSRYVVDAGIKKEEVDRYIDIFPEKIYKQIYETKLYKFLA